MKFFSSKRRWYVSIIGLAIALAVVVVTVLIISVITALVQQRKLNAIVTTDLTVPQLTSQAIQQQVNGDFSGAEQSLEEALVKQQSPDLQSQLAVVQYRLKKYQDSITQYQKLVSAKQDVAFAWNGIGNSYRDWAASTTTDRTNRENSAISAYNQAITADPGYVAAYVNEALLLVDMGKKSDAIALLQTGYSKTQVKQLQDLVSQLQL